MVTATAATAATLTLVGEALLFALLLRLAGAFRRHDDGGAYRRLLVAMPLLALGAVARTVRYAAGGPGSTIETILNLGAHAAAWILVYRALSLAPPLERETTDALRGTRRAAAIVATTGTAAALLGLLAESFGFVPALLAVEFGFLAASAALVGWRLRASAGPEWPARLAVATGFLLVAWVWLRNLVFLSVNRDRAFFEATRAGQAAVLLLAAVLLAPAVAAFAARLRRSAPLRAGAAAERDTGGAARQEGAASPSEAGPSGDASGRI